MERRHIGWLLLALALCGCKKPGPARALAFPTQTGQLTARIHNFGFDLAHDTYNGISTAADGKVYYALSSEKRDQARE